MQNSIELRDLLSSIVDGLKNGKIEPKTAKEVINATGKIIQSISVELKHDMYHKIESHIDFLAKPEKQKAPQNKSSRY